MAKAKLTIGNWYKFNDQGESHIGQYMGNDQGFECCVCGKGCKARTFNVWYGEDYETWGYGADHMPTIIEDLGISEAPIIDR